MSPGRPHRHVRPPTTLRTPSPPPPLHRSIIPAQSQTLDHGAIPVPEPHAPLELVFPEDRASIQINLFRVLEALTQDRIDTRTANSMTWNIQASMTNLDRKSLIETEPVGCPQSRATDEDAGCPTPGFSDLGSRPASRSVQRIILTPEGDEIAPPVAILEEDEAEPIHHSLCPLPALLREAPQLARRTAPPPMPVRPMRRTGACSATKPNPPPVLQQPWPRVSSRRRMSPSLPDSSIPTPRRASKTRRGSSTATNTGQPTSAAQIAEHPELQQALAQEEDFEL